MQNCRKFSAVLGVVSAKSSILMRPRGSPPRVMSKKTIGLPEGAAMIVLMFWCGRWEVKVGFTCSGWRGSDWLVGEGRLNVGERPLLAQLQVHQVELLLWTSSMLMKLQAQYAFFSDLGLKII